MQDGARHQALHSGAGSRERLLWGGTQGRDPHGPLVSDLPASPLGADGCRGSECSHGGEPKALMSTL